MFPVKFLFIGHIRKEKGINNLITAWSSLDTEAIGKAYLTIAGNDDLNLGEKAINLTNCVTKFGYLDDKEFESLIKDSDYIVLPYHGGTNSGVLAVASSFGKPCITSMIPCFSQSQFFLKDLSFRHPEELPSLLSNVIEQHLIKYDTYRDFLLSINEIYQRDFDTDIQCMYGELGSLK